MRALELSEAESWDQESARYEVLMESDSQLSLGAMINEGTAWLDDYLRGFENGSPVPDNSMLGIFEGAVGRARRETDADSSLAWSGIAIRAADLGARQDNVWRRHMLLRAMNHRAWCIGRMGSREGYPVLDKKIILRWFEEELPFSKDSTKGKATTVWDKVMAAQGSGSADDLRCAVDDLRELRYLKNRIGVLKRLDECDELPVDSSLNEWLAIGEQLP